MKNYQKLINLCVDSVKNPERVQTFAQGGDVDATIRNQFFEIMGVTNPTMKDIRRHKVEIFEILEEVLTETYRRGVDEDEFFMRFAEIRNVSLGDQQEFFVEDDTILVVSEHAGSHWDITRQKLEGGNTFRIKTKSYAIGIYGDFFLFTTGRLSFGRLIGKVAQAIQYKIYEEVAASFANAITLLPPEFRATGTYDQLKLQNLVAHVEASSGSNAIVVGTRQALAKVMNGVDVHYYSQEMKNEYARTGIVARVAGMTLIELPAVHKKNTFDFAYDENQLLVFPTNDEKFIKLIFEGEDRVYEVQNEYTNMDMSFEYKFITKFGCGVVFNTLFAVYTLA